MQTLRTRDAFNQPSATTAVISNSVKRVSHMREASAALTGMAVGGAMARPLLIPRRGVAKGGKCVSSQSDRA